MLRNAKRGIICFVREKGAPLSLNFDDENLPIADLSLLSAGVNGMLNAGHDLLALLKEAKLKPHILDDAIIERTSHGRFKLLNFLF